MATRPAVLVLPGLAASDVSTQAIRSSLIARGHWAHGWRLGRNRGPSAGLTKLLDARLEELFLRHSRPIALVGWSMGGWYAHELARKSPGKVHCVVSMGSPLARSGSRRPRLQVPTTSIFSRKDRVVPWENSLVDADAPRHENVEVRSGHLTLGIDPAVLYAVGDRVSRQPSAWTPFVPPRFLSSAFPDRLTPGE
jgi:pimeloyl-ACP methyl ester carboxylesterase